MDNYHNENTRAEIDSLYKSKKEINEVIKIIQDNCLHDKTIPRKTYRNKKASICLFCDKIIINNK